MKYKGHTVPGTGISMGEALLFVACCLILGWAFFDFGSDVKEHAANEKDRLSKWVEFSSRYCVPEVRVNSEFVLWHCRTLRYSARVGEAPQNFEPEWSEKYLKSVAQDE